MIENNLPILHVIIPLLSAAICAMFKNGRTAWFAALIATWISFAIISTLFLITSEIDFVKYAMGGWQPPIGIEYKIDQLNSFVLLIVSFIGAVMMPYARRSIESEVAEEKLSLFYSVYLLCFAGLLGVLSTNDIFNIYVFLEISSLSMYTLIAMGKDRRALTAAFEYLILGTIGATFILIGIGFLYIMTGTLNITDMASRIGDIADPRPLAAAFAFLTLGLALKTALFPLHIWLVNSYAYAPSFISSFLSATATKVGAYIFIRFIYTLFGFQFSFVNMPLGIILMVLAVVGIFVGSTTAIFQPNVKRLLAFSSIAQLGYIALGFSIATEAGLTASILHLFNHALAKGLLFLSVGAVVFRTGGIRIEHFNGIAKHMPFTMAAFVVGGLSLIGVPGTAGFISKWSFLTSLLEQNLWYLVAVLLISSLLAVIYIWRVVEAAYFKHSEDNTIEIKEAPISMLIPMFVLAACNIYYGFATDMTLGVAAKIASGLM